MAWKLIELDFEGRQWLTDGTDGIDPSAVPDLLEACKAMKERITELQNDNDYTWNDWPESYEVDAALAKAVAHAN